MKKTENINLGGKPFIIDQDAFFKLNDYLKAVRLQFEGSGDTDEIMHDIEYRIAELFIEKKQNNPIVNLAHVSEIISIMGTPDDYSENDKNNATYQTEKEDLGNDNSQTTSFSPGKKLFRDPEDKMIAGICSGLSKYLGISDPVWIRILFVILVVGGFSGVIIYLIMWAVIPEAKTSSDRLLMKGKDINISSIADDIEKEFNDLSDIVTDMSKDFKWKGKK